MTKQTYDILGHQVAESELREVLKKIINTRGVSGTLTLEPKAPQAGNATMYKYAFFDCLG